MTPQERDLAAVWRAAEAAGRRARETEERGRAIAQQIRCALRAAPGGNEGWPARMLLEALDPWLNARSPRVEAGAAAMSEPLAQASLRMTRNLLDERERLAARADLLPRLPAPLQAAEADALLAGGMRLLESWFEAESVVQEAALCLARAGQWRRALAGAAALAQGRRRSNLADLAPLLPPESMGEALAAATAMPEGERGGPRLDALVALIPRLPPDLLPEAVGAGRALSSPAARVQALSAALPALPAADRPLVAEEALADALRVPGVSERGEALGKALPYLAESQAQAARAELLDAIRQEPRPVERAQALASALGLAPATERPSLLEEVLALARRLAPEEKARAYAEILRRHPLLSAAEQEEIAAEAVAAITAMDDVASQNDALRALAEPLARLPAPALHRPWCDALRYLAARPRLFLSLRHLLPVMDALGGAMPLRALAREAERLAGPAPTPRQRPRRGSRSSPSAEPPSLRG